MLNTNTGLVSPQFHVTYDDFFETVRPSAQNPIVKSQWQALAGFRSDDANGDNEGAQSTPIPLTTCTTTKHIQLTARASS